MLKHTDIEQGGHEYRGDQHNSSNELEVEHGDKLERVTDLLTISLFC